MELLKALAPHVNQAWDKVTLNVEIADVSGSETVSEDGDIWYHGKSEQLILNIVIQGIFRELRQLMEEQDFERRAWS